MKILGKKNAEELTNAFKAIPANIISFHLSNNNFQTEQVKALFTALGCRQDVQLDFGEDKIDQELKEEIHETNMNRSLLGHLLSHTFFADPEAVPASDLIQQTIRNERQDSNAPCIPY